MTSEQTDPVFIKPPEGVTSFCIGKGSVRTSVFVELEGPLVIMTMPDLGVYYIKRSERVKHYAYIFHSINSCHMVYRPRAFDFYDSIFCAGPHQVREIQSLEKLNNLKPKKIIRQGYPRLEAIANDLDRHPSKSNNNSGPNSAIKVLIAPSWGKNALLERHGGNFIEPLLKAGFDVILRPHPETHKHSQHILKGIHARCHKYKNYTLETEVASTASLIEADIMISDYSGAAIEFAFSTQKPVLFVDVPKKINNANYTDHNIDPLEVFIRSEIGEVIPENMLYRMDHYITEAIRKRGTYTDKILQIRKEYIYNFGQSSRIAANELMNILANSTI
ncbi:CDP-glycerol glycerophosphotransferase family protein [Daejeonella lutea]|uniref:CDP-glycerol glycerophosphotransferase family protein n=1 Tax=Daejeonella lutea TaxID=572036 RepID=UPI0014835EA2|nr:CDP-glycerol glycerophosphotransferase family protein [Daejeonella lutea]